MKLLRLSGTQQSLEKQGNTLTSGSCFELCRWEMCRECYKPPALTQTREQGEDRALGQRAGSLENGNTHAFQPAMFPATRMQAEQGSRKVYVRTAISEMGRHIQ